MISPSQFYCLKRPMLGKPFISVLLRIETGLLVWVQEVLNLFINLVPLIGNDFLVLVSLFHHGCQKVRSFFQETHFLHIFSTSWTYTYKLFAWTSKHKPDTRLPLTFYLVYYTKFHLFVFVTILSSPNSSSIAAILLPISYVGIPRSIAKNCD